MAPGAVITVGAVAQLRVMPSSGPQVSGSPPTDLTCVQTLCSRQDGDKNPLWFTLGMREVLPGWDKGLQDMCTGERRKLTVPPALAYGKEGKGITQKKKKSKL